MTRLFLAAGVAALAIAAPSAAKPGGGNGGGQKAEHGGGQQRAERQQSPQRAERQQVRAERQQARTERPQLRAERQQVRVQRAERQQMRAQRAERVQQAQNQRIERQQLRAQRVERVQQAQNKRFERQQMRAERIQQAQNRPQARFDRQMQRVANRDMNLDSRDLRAQGYGMGGCPPGLAKKAVQCVPPGQAAKLGLAPFVTTENAAVLRAARVDALNRAYATNLLAPATAASLLGLPLARATGIAPLMALPQSASYLYPDTNDYYYRYGNGYLYQVDRGSNLIESLLPLLAGGLLPGSYLPQNYMNSYVPNYYGLNSFYPSNYSNYGGYGDYYGNTCNRYADGVIYQVDCGSGLIQNVVPTYAAGYGVGQMLPSAYGYYNLPSQYRSLYQPTDDYSYWYAPGAIYQYDPSSSLITSVAALLAPGLTVGQQLPTGYGMYNVPLAYRDTYYDTSDAWYRYNNGNIYQIDPTTQLVTAIVASLLT